MATTTNFGWETPDDTDLVKDGAAAIRTLGSAIDTSLVDLKGGTTNQVLAKNSNTDMDFKWVADASGIPATIFDAKGDLIAATAADTADRLAVGANGTVLTADSTAATGLKWAAPASGLTWTLLNTGGTSLSSTTTTVSGISDKEYLMILLRNASSANSTQIYLRFNSDSGSNYYWGGLYLEGLSTYGAAYTGPLSSITGTEITAGIMSGATTSTVSGSWFLTGCKSTGLKSFQGLGQGSAASNTGQLGYLINGMYNGSAAITSISIISNSGNFDAGTVYVYGA